MAKKSDVKYYFFRDLESGSNFDNGKEFHASGIVQERYNENSPSGKDLAVLYLDVFKSTVECAWRADNEIQLYEVSDYEWKEASKILELINNQQ